MQPEEKLSAIYWRYFLKHLGDEILDGPLIQFGKSFSLCDSSHMVQRELEAEFFQLLCLKGDCKVFDICSASIFHV